MEELGPVIEVNGMPDWLDGEEKILAAWGDYWYNTPTWVSCYSSPERITQIRLRADHPYYTVAKHGFHYGDAENDDDYVRVKRMTLAEYQRDDHGSCAWARRVGIIREETEIERFERDNGGLRRSQRDILEVFLEWRDGQNG